jgi:hypothetical protein
MLKCIGLICTLAVLACGSSRADVLQVQTTPFSFSQSGTSTGDFTIVGAGDLTTGNTIAPFNSSLGQLVSFAVAWNMSYDASGTTGSDAGSIAANVNGTYLIAGIGYVGGVNGEGDGGPPGSPESFSFAVDDSHSFPIPASGYNPAILAAVTGTSDFALEFSSDYILEVDNSVANWTADADGSVAITYDYLPVPEPPSLMLLLAALPLVCLRHRLGKGSHPGSDRG